MSKSVQLLSAFMSYDSLQKEWEPHKRNILKKKKVIYKKISISYKVLV